MGPRSYSQRHAPVDVGHSALPGAPVVPDRRAFATRVDGARASMSSALRRLARWIEPAAPRSIGRSARPTS